jgi:hypothetical protein
MVIKYKSIYRKKCFNNPLFLLLKVSGLFLFQKSQDNVVYCVYTAMLYTVLPRSIANLAYRQNSRLSRFPPLKIPRYTAKLSYRHSPQVFRHKSRKTNLNSPVSTAHKCNH